MEKAKVYQTRRWPAPIGCSNSKMLTMYDEAKILSDPLVAPRILPRYKFKRFGGFIYEIALQISSVARVGDANAVVLR